MQILYLWNQVNVEFYERNSIGQQYKTIIHLLAFIFMIIILVIQNQQFMCQIKAFHVHALSGLSFCTFAHMILLVYVRKYYFFFDILCHYSNICSTICNMQVYKYILKKNENNRFLKETMHFSSISAFMYVWNVTSRMPGIHILIAQRKILYEK